MFAHRPVPWFFPNSTLLVSRITCGIFALALLLPAPGRGDPPPMRKEKNPHHGADTVFVCKGLYILTMSLMVKVPRDTSYVIHHPTGNIYDSSGYRKSKVFYDTVYNKFNRSAITKLIYPLAFHEPKQSNLPDTVQVMKGTSPFEVAKGKIIRNIRIEVLSPFGTSIYDTCSYAQTTAGKALNSVHRNTRQFIVRRNLLFKKGDRVNPGLLADNERILKEINAVDNARIIVTPTGPGSDSADLVVLVKDVWTIGLDVPFISSEKIGLRIFDANFLGLSDRITAKMSVNPYRAPLYRLDGLTYTHPNIGGSFINATLDYTRSDPGEQNLSATFDRAFYTNQTRWAGGLVIAWREEVNEIKNSKPDIAYSGNESLWLGLASLLNGPSATSRAVVTAGISRNEFSSRPYISIDSNRNYYNHLQFLSALSLSKNNYYLTDFLFDFGKTENLPYGHLFQVTGGYDKTDYYARIYAGAVISGGNFFNRVGYLEAYARFGGFLDASRVEDAVIKFNLSYFTPLIKTSERGYKYRCFFLADYRHVFNQRSNNRDYYNANLIFNIDKINNPAEFRGANFISVRTAMKCFTPWYFYGFRFALTADLQSGLVSQKDEPLVHASLFSGIGVGIVIKNDNLVFPALSISGYYYPSSAWDISEFQFVINSRMNVAFYNFNVSAPYEESLGN